MSQNVYTIMYMNVEEERLCIKSWMDCGIVSIGQLFGPDGYLTYNAFRTRFPNAEADFFVV